MTKDFEPLEIKIKILSPIVAPLRRQPHPLHLDALVISIMTARNKHHFPLLSGDTDYEDPYAPENGHKQGVPFAVCGNNSPIYQASVAFADGDIAFDDYNWIKKAPDVSMQQLLGTKKRNPRYNQGGESSGKERAWMESMKGVLPAEIIFECVGDKQALTNILKDVRGLGVMRRIGLGEILAISITKSEKSIEDCGFIRDGQPARELPCCDWPEQKGWNAVAATTRPPYWNPHNTEISWCPPLELTVPGMALVKRTIRNAEARR
jgi:CRISPR type IV-associated protein Csf3